MLHEFLHDARTVQQRAEALSALCTEHGYVAYLEWAITGRGWALAAQGQAEEGIPQIHQGLAIARARGVELFRPHWLALLAEAYEKAGQTDDGLVALAEALTVVDKSGKRFYEAELYRLKGELTLQRFNVQGSKFKVEDSLGSRVQRLESEAEEYFLKAIAVARRQQVKSLELRATVSLARLWQHQGKQKEAHAMLSDIYHWFTEGFDTKDLQEAKVLLEQLAEAPQ
jgi:predicted ATPase